MGPTLQELSAAAKVHFEAREYQLAANLLNEARDRFPQEDGKTIDQASDGSFVITDEEGKQEPVG
jgi:hypothetical protein